MDQREHPTDDERGLGPEPSGVRTIAVLRSGGLGDVVRAIPAIRHLRSAFPDAVMTVAAGAAGLDLLASCPYVDRVVDADRPSELLMEQYDLAVQLDLPTRVPGGARGPLRGGIRVEAVRAGSTAGFRLVGEPSTLRVHPVLPRRLSEVDQMLRLAWLLGGDEPDAGLALWPTLADRNAAARLVEWDDAPVCVVHVGARTSERRCSVQQLVSTIDGLAATGVVAVLVGTEVDAPMARAVRAAAAASVTDVVGQTPVGVLAGLLERASMFVGADSGPAALAIAVGAHAVVIGPASSLAPAGSGAVTTWVTAGPCAVCGETACDHPLAEASAVPLEPVLAAVEVVARRARDAWQRSRER